MLRIGRVFFSDRVLVTDELRVDTSWRHFCRQLRIACIVAWLDSFPSVRFETDAERDACICMWLQASPEAIELWATSEWAS